METIIPVSPFCLLRRAGACCCRAAFCSLWALGGIVAWWWFALALGPFSLWTWAEWAAIDSGLHLHVPNGLPSNDSTSRQRPTESDLKHNKNMMKELTSDAPKSSTTNIASSNVFHSFEHPRYAQSWETQTPQQLEGYDEHIEQCHYGATMPDHNGIEQYIRKPTRLRVTHELLAEQLERICTENHYHLPLEGSSPNIGNRLAAAGSYHPKMCKQWSSILHDFMQHVFWPHATTEAIKMVLLGLASMFDHGRHFMYPQLMSTPHGATSRTQEPPRSEAQTSRTATAP